MARRALAAAARLARAWQQQAGGAAGAPQGARALAAAAAPRAGQAGGGAAAQRGRPLAPGPLAAGGADLVRQQAACAAEHLRGDPLRAGLPGREAGQADHASAQHTKDHGPNAVTSRSAAACAWGARPLWGLQLRGGPPAPPQQRYAHAWAGPALRWLGPLVQRAAGGALPCEPACGAAGCPSCGSVRGMATRAPGTERPQAGAPALQAAADGQRPPGGGDASSPRPRGSEAARYGAGGTGPERLRDLSAVARARSAAAPGLVRRPPVAGGERPPPGAAPAPLGAGAARVQPGAAQRPAPPGLRGLGPAAGARGMAPPGLARRADPAPSLRAGPPFPGPPPPAPPGRRREPGPGLGDPGPARGAPEEQPEGLLLEPADPVRLVEEGGAHRVVPYADALAAARAANLDLIAVQAGAAPPVFRLGSRGKRSYAAKARRPPPPQPDDQGRLGDAAARAQQPAIPWLAAAPAPRMPA